MAYSPTEEAIALLIDLAERGEIDPWDVQVIEVIDRFLSRIASTSSSHDLSESGQALLHAAMLVYLKAMALAEPEVDEGEPSPADVEADPLPSWSLADLDGVLQPRAVPRLQRSRPVTLKELIVHLQELETLLEHRPEAAPKPLSQRVSRQQALSAITQLAHPENLLETTAELESLLAQLWQQGLTQVSFAALQQHFCQNGSSGAIHPIQVFWSLLLMAARSQVELCQEEFYGPLTIRPCPMGSLLPTALQAEL
ncbi:segregation/condensation protein A [Synechococcus sp. H55.7]|uniref:segregation/condensation protein A n=1 Tax=unclassified Synechococcus TaxID=2626047 RepID=UPI0039C0CBDE